MPLLLFFVPYFYFPVYFSILAFSSLFAFFLIAFSFARFLFFGLAFSEPRDYRGVFVIQQAPFSDREERSWFTIQLIRNPLDCIPPPTF